MKNISIPKRMPLPISLGSSEREYHRFLRAYVGKYIDLMRTALGTVIPGLLTTARRELPRIDSDIRMDENVNKKLEKLFDWVESELDRSFSEETLRKHAKKMVGSVNAISKKNTAKAVRSVYRQSKEKPAIEHFLGDKDLHPYFENIIDKNVGLIKSIPREKHEALKNQLTAMITNGASQKEIAKAIEKKFGIDKNKAAFIARDQVSKLNGKMNQYRQQKLGAKRYTWRSSADKRERPDHRKLNNIVQKWSKPPIVNRILGKRGHPGEDYNCRCWAEMVLKDILD